MTSHFILGTTTVCAMFLPFPVHTLDSIAISVFVVILVDSDRIWDEQACLANTLCSPRLVHFHLTGHLYKNWPLSRVSLCSPPVLFSQSVFSSFLLCQITLIFNKWKLPPFLLSLLFPDLPELLRTPAWLGVNTFSFPAKECLKNQSNPDSL